MSDENIVNMAFHSGSAKMLSPEGALREALKDIGENGAFKDGKKLLILALDESNDEYSISFIQAGMSMSECISLCEISKSVFKNQMGY